MQWKNAHPDRYDILKEYARENRKFMTEAETLFWNYVKDNSLGHKFLRQYIIGDYIVDFYCRDAQIAIEIDGAYHCERDQMQDDEIRQLWLEKMGFKVIRFSNDEIYTNFESVLQKLLSAINERLH